MTCQGSADFLRFREPPKISWHHKSDIKHIPYGGLGNVRRHTNFNRPGDLAPWICAPLRSACGFVCVCVNACVLRLDPEVICDVTSRFE